MNQSGGVSEFKVFFFFIDNAQVAILTTSPQMLCRATREYKEKNSPPLSHPAQ